MDPFDLLDYTMITVAVAVLIFGGVYFWRNRAKR
jgi:hypothetical protein